MSVLLKVGRSQIFAAQHAEDGSVTHDDAKTSGAEGVFGDQVAQPGEIRDSQEYRLHYILDAYSFQNAVRSQALCQDRSGEANKRGCNSHNNFEEPSACQY
jgi:hypothetical protein